MPEIFFPAGLLTAVSWICEIFFLHFRKSGCHHRSLLLKVLASACFTGIGFLFSAWTEKGIFVVWGLSFGLLGDLLLALRKLLPSRSLAFFLAGALAFSVGHFFYMAELNARYGNLLLYSLPILLLLITGSEVFSRKSGFSQKKMHLPGLFYIAIEAVMCSLSLVGFAGNPGLSSGLFAAGGLSFLISDNLLCAFSFGRMKTSSVDHWLHITYLGAQLLIAWSIAFS